MLACAPPSGSMAHEVKGPSVRNKAESRFLTSDPYNRVQSLEGSHESPAYA